MTIFSSRAEVPTSVCCSAAERAVSVTFNIPPSHFLQNRLQNKNSEFDVRSSGMDEVNFNCKFRIFQYGILTDINFIY